MPRANLVSGDIESRSAESESKRYVVGPMLELRLLYGFGIEFDALYRRFGFRTDDGFPILVKYRLPVLRRIRQSAAVGYAPRRISGKEHTVGETIDFATGVRTPFVYSGEWHPKVAYGLVAAGGVEFGGGRLRVAPEIRYTRWLKDPINDNSSQDYSISGARNQMEILVGFTWR